MPLHAAIDHREPPRSYQSLRMWVWAFAVAFIALFASLQAVFLVEQRETALRAGEDHARSDALAAAAQLRGVLAAFDAALAQVAAHSPRLGGPSGAAGAWWAFLETVLIGTTDISALAVTDADGIIRHSTDRSMIGTSLAHQYAFQHLRTERAVPVAVETPRVDANGAVTLALVRRLTHNFDEFSGVAVATFSPDVLRRISQNFHVHGGHIRIVHPKGIILIHEPSDQSLTGNAADDDPALITFRAGRAEGMLRSTVDTNRMIVAFRALSEPSLIAAVSHTEDEILEEWREDVIFDSIIAGGLSLSLLVAAFLIVRRLRAQEAAEQELARRDHELRLAQAIAGVGSVAIDVGGGIMRCSPEFRRIAAWPPGEDTVPIGRFRELIAPAERTRLDDAVRHASNTGEGFELDLRAKCGDGAERVLRLRGSVDHAAGTLIAVQDVTDVLEAEARARESQKIEAVGQLTGGVAHDFNNLLTVILGNAEQLMQDLQDRPDLRPMAQMTLVAAERGAELTRRLLAFARRQTLSPQETDVNALIAGMDGLLRRTLGEQVAIRLAPEASLWPTRVDANQLETALLNLAINARDAMPAGGSLTIRTENVFLDGTYAAGHDEVRPGDYVAISVCDTGCGMSPEVRTRAFEPFFTTKEVGKGSGLGLSMVFGFVKQSGGHVSIYSEVGYGTEVRLYLPRSGGTVIDSAPSRAGKPVGGGRETIFMVEDEDLVRDSARAMLESLGYQVQVADNGPRALVKLAAPGQIDLLLTDLMMPGGMNGRTLANEAVKLRPGLRVLFMSGYSEEILDGLGDARQARFLHKPFRRDQLATAIREALAAGPYAPRQDG